MKKEDTFAIADSKLLKENFARGSSFAQCQGLNRQRIEERSNR